MSKGKFELYEFEAGNPTSISLEAPIQCTPKNCTFSAGFIDFIPTLPVNAFFLAIFGFFIMPQIYFGIKYRTIGFTTAMLVGLALEVTGYVGVIQMHFSPTTLPPSLMGLTLGPIFIAGAAYFCLDQVRRVFDPEDKILMTRARMYAWVFRISSLISLVMQIVGGLLAGFAENQNKLRIGTVILSIGYATQLYPLSLSCFLYLRFYWNIKRFSHVKDNKYLANIKRFLWALLFAGTFILVRCTFRVVELSLPFENIVARHEAFALGFDGVMILLACITLTVIHPGIMLADAYREAKLYV